jgi:hypothetical protein
MPFEKGRSKTGGRASGVVNKATQDARQAIALFVDQSAPKLLDWLDQVANGMPDHDIKPNPAKAIELVQNLCEYHIPKLARTELSGSPDGSPIRHAWTVEMVRPK